MVDECGISARDTTAVLVRRDCTSVFEMKAKDVAAFFKKDIDASDTAPAWNDAARAGLHTVLEAQIKLIANSVCCGVAASVAVALQPFGVLCGARHVPGAV